MPSSTALACARELLATEKTYAAGLKCFLDNFVYKLPKADAAVDRMSRNINGVLTVHESLGLANDKLAAQIVQEPCTAIVAVAESISKADFVQPYATCINDLETMEREVARLRKGRLHGDIAALERNLPLQSVSAYLIMPVQRIPRLIMMMATIEKGLTTDDICEHPDVKSQVDHALQSLSDCASLLNEAKRSKEIHDLLTSVVENSPDIQFNPLAGRRLLKHSGVQRDHKRSGLTAPTASHCLLFDDRVCVVNRKFQLKSDVVLAGTNVTVTQYDSPPGRHHTWRYGLMFQQGTSRPK
ncbi:DH domain-containing protein [Plasmodiophora brassicae]|nr:hypothetical protein PBRA_005222 [Plasmodiophora brassicae]